MNVSAIIGGGEQQVNLCTTGLQAARAAAAVFLAAAAAIGKAIYHTWNVNERCEHVTYQPKKKRMIGTEMMSDTSLTSVSIMSYRLQWPELVVYCSSSCLFAALISFHINNTVVNMGTGSVAQSAQIVAAW